MGPQGVRKVRQELREFERNRRARLIPLMKSLSGGHRFTLTDLGEETQVDHELEMVPMGLARIMAPLIRTTGRRNLSRTAAALKRHLEQI
jgi:hypothetical protein